MAVDVTATVCAITGVRAAPTLGQPIWNTLADNACSYHVDSLAPAVALPAPRHDRRRTGAAGSPPGGFPFLEGRLALVPARVRGCAVSRSAWLAAARRSLLPTLTKRRASRALICSNHYAVNVVPSTSPG